MNIITNILISIYFYTLLKLEYFDLFIIISGAIFPNFEKYILFFIKDKLKLYNKLFHSFFYVIPLYIVFSLLYTAFMEKGFLSVFLLSILGFLIHVFSDVTKSKAVFLLHPFKKSYHFGVSSYFDLLPNIILIISSFFLVLLKDELYFWEKLVPLFIFLFYFLMRYYIKRRIKKLLLDANTKGQNIIILPTLKFNVWNIIRVADKHVYLFSLDIFKKKYLFVKYFSHHIPKELLEEIKERPLFKNYSANFQQLYYQTYNQKKRTIVRVFDVKNFFNLFKREQVYYEAVFVEDKCIKEQLNL